MFAKYKIIREKADSFKKSLKMPKGVIRIRKSKKNKRKKDKRTNSDPQNNTHKTKDRVTRIPLKPGVNLGRIKDLHIIYTVGASFA